MGSILALIGTSICLVRFKRVLLVPIAFGLLFMLPLGIHHLNAQNNKPSDSIKRMYPRIALKTPVKHKVHYDSISKRFVVSQKSGHYHISNPRFLSLRSYDDYLMKRDIKKYYASKLDLIGGLKKATKASRKNLLPTYYVNNKFFTSLFGSGDITVDAKANIDFRLGVIYQDIKNPNISVDNQSNLIVDFNQKIAASFNAKIGKRIRVSANYDTQATFDFQNIFKISFVPGAESLYSSLLTKDADKLLKEGKGLVTKEIDKLADKKEKLLAKTGKKRDIAEKLLDSDLITSPDKLLEEDPNELLDLGNKDDILQGLDVGNVSMDMSNRLIAGSRNLFGVKTKMVFGNTTVNAVFSQQRSDQKTIVAERGGTTTPFELKATDYDVDRHFFIAHYFRNHYNDALAQRPMVQSPIQITRIEVWITNRNLNTNAARNIVALTDLGEKGTDHYDAAISNISNTAVTPNAALDAYPDNQSNSLRAKLGAGTGLRQRSTIDNELPNPTYKEGVDYVFLEKARKLSARDYTFDPVLGTISLKQPLNSGDALAVAFQYTVVGATKTHQVGELSTDGVQTKDNLIVKLIRSNMVNPQHRSWDLMMKNVYELNAYQFEKDDFRLEVLYKDDKTGVGINSLQNLPDADNRKKTLLNLMGLDVLNQNNFPRKQGDGYFDFLGGITVYQQNGTIFFPTLEPFGRDLEKKIGGTVKEYIFKELYQVTQFQAKNQYQIKDKYRLTGYYKSSMGDGISLDAFNIPRGSVKVTSGGILLKEGIDYTVDYLGGRLKIINPNIQKSGAPIQVSLERQNLFNQNFKRFIGFDVVHRFSNRFQMSATYLNLNERPVTQKVNIGQDPISNHILGLTMQYQTPLAAVDDLLARLNRKAGTPSELSLRGDFAYLVPDSPSSIDLAGEATAYIDDFEDAQRPIEITGARAWKLASKPLNFTNDKGERFDFGSETPNDLDYGKNRAKLAWYNIDRIFYQNNSLKPKNIDGEEQSRMEVSAVLYSELFPRKELDVNQLDLMNTLDLAYYPSERGSYNYDTDTDLEGFLNRPAKRWAGITRAIGVNDFQQSNIEYVQFWMQDPYQGYSITEREGAKDRTPVKDGLLFLNLGNISEDILKDNLKQYENGLPESGKPKSAITSVWGDLPETSKFIYTFDANVDNREAQDVGLDGLSDADEKVKFPALASLDDPSSDNYEFYRGTRHDRARSSILERYKNYNNTEGNSPIGRLSKESYPTMGSTEPDAEDINRDQTMNTINAYYQYPISLKAADLVLGKNYIVDVKKTIRSTPLGDKEVKWYQFRIPVRNGTPIGGIANFNSIRFMRFYLTKFQSPVVLRLAKIELVQGSWIRSLNNIHDGVASDGDVLNTKEQANFKVGVVNLEENESRNPVPYVLPPGVQREQTRGSGNNLQQQNEQSLSLKIKELPKGDTRGVYKNTDQDFRMYKNLKMFVHAEAMDSDAVKDDEVVAILRMGSDIEQHYYQVEMPLKITPLGSKGVAEIWPKANEMMVDLKKLAALKIDRHKVRGSTDSQVIFPKPVTGEAPAYRMRVKGFPNLANIKTILLGVRNASSDGNKKSVEVWFNELRVAGFEKDGGWAAQLETNLNVGDLVRLTVTGKYQTIGFGDINQRTDQRSQEEVKQYGLISSLNFGKVLPPKWGISLPLSYQINEVFKNPKYDPLYQDLLYKDTRDINPQWSLAQDYTRHKGISLINIHKTKSGGKKHFFDIENFNASYAFKESFRKNYTIVADLQQELNASVGYRYAFKPITLAFFKKISFFNNEYLRLLRDFNLNLLPRNIQINANIRRTFNRYQSRPLVAGLSVLPALKQYNFLFDWDYSINYPISRALNLNFKVANHHIYDNFEQDDGDDLDLNLYSNLFNVGRPQKYTHQLKANYQLPIHLLPFMGFLSSRYSYTTDFEWQANAPYLQKRLGNDLSNANTHNFNLSAQLSRLYSSLGIRKLFKPTAKKSPFHPRNFFYNLLTMVKSAQFNFNQNNSTLLPGYANRVNFAKDLIKGRINPSWGFLFGEQADIRDLALANNWLATRTINKASGADDAYVNRMYQQNKYEKYNFTAVVKPLQGLNVSIRASRIKTRNRQQQLDPVIDAQKSTDVSRQIRRFNPTVFNESGNFSMSHNMIGTFFTNPDVLFDNFLKERTPTRQFLASKTGQAVDGFSSNGQQVLFSAFVNAYKGRSVSSNRLDWFSKIPGLNWSVNYTGLMRMDWFKKNFRAFSLRHAYTGRYTLASFRNNPNYKVQADGTWARDANGYFYEPLIAQNLILSDGFKPLIQVNVGMKNNFSLKGQVDAQRTLTLNFTNNTLSQVTATTYILGLGYRITNLKTWFKVGGKTRKSVGNINVRADLRYQKSLTLIREIATGGKQITAGQNIFSLKVKVDYQLNKSLSAFVYYDHLASRYAISTAFPRTTMSGGVGFTYRIGD